MWMVYKDQALDELKYLFYTKRKTTTKIIDYPRYDYRKIFIICSNQFIL